MALRIAKSAAVALVASVVCANTYLLALVTSISLRGPYRGAVAFDVVSLFRQDARFWLVVAATFCLVTAYGLRSLNRGAPLPLPLMAATLSFLVTSAASGLFLSAVWAASPHPDAEPVWVLAIGMWSLDAATFAFFAGLAGGAWLAQRRTRIHSTGRLVGESAAAGASLGAVMGLLVVLLGTPPAPPREMLILSLLFALPGSVCAVLVGLALRGRIVSVGRTDPLAA